MRSVRAVPALVDAFVRDMRSRTRKTGDMLQGIPRGRAPVGVSAIIAIGTPGSRALASQLERIPETYLRDWCFNLLEGMSPLPYAALGELLVHADVGLRQEALGRIYERDEFKKHIAPYLIAALRRRDNLGDLRVAHGDVARELLAFRQQLLDAFLQVGADASVVRQTLERLLDDRFLHMRIETAECLATVGDEASTARLRLALERAACQFFALDTSDDDRFLASALLATAAQSIAILSGDPDGETAFRALVDALREPAAGTRDRIDAPGALWASPPLGYPTVDAILRALESDDAHVRRCGAWAVEERRESPPRVLQALAARLDDVDDTVRSAAARALASETGEWQSENEPRLVAAAARALAIGGHSTRYRSVLLLGALAGRHPPAREALEAVQNHMDGRVRRTVAAALAALE